MRSVAAGGGTAERLTYMAGQGVGLRAHTHTHTLQPAVDVSRSRIDDVTGRERGDDAELVAPGEWQPITDLGSIA